MSNTNENKPLLQHLALKAPSCLEEALGYTGKSRWLGLYWEPELNQVCYTDGHSLGMGNEKAWQILCTHPKVKPLFQPYHFGDRSQSTEYCYLLLDRETRKLYLGEGEVVESCLTEPQTLALLAALDSPLAVPMTNNDQKRWLNWSNLQTRPIIIGSALLVLLGLPTIGFGAAVILDEKDWVEVELPEWMD